jgi:hypothetical protein
LKEHFEVEDFFDSKGKLRYSWDNRHRDKIRVLARLNRLYAHKVMGTWRDGSIVSYEIKGDSGVFDHCSVLFCCRMGEPNNVKGGIFCMNNKHLNNPIAIVKMTRFWNG